MTQTPTTTDADAVVLEELIRPDRTDPPNAVLSSVDTARSPCTSTRSADL